MAANQDCPLNIKNLRFRQLYTYLLNEYKEVSIKPFLTTYKWGGKDKLESLYRLFAYLQVIPDFNGYQVMTGCFTVDENSDKKLSGDVTISQLMWKKVKDSGDKSDLTLTNIEKSTIIASTSKNSENLAVGKYDLTQIYTDYIRFHANTYDNLILPIVVPCKKEFEKTVKKARATTQTPLDIINNRIENVKTKVYDYNDIDIWFQTFKNNYKGVDVSSLCPKQSVEMRFHQAVGIERYRRIKDKYKDILIGMKQRLGKTYMMFHIINDCEISHSKPVSNYLIISLKPNDTKDQIYNLFTNSKEFDNFNFTIVDSEYTKKKPESLKDKNILFASKAFLDKKVKGSKVIKWLQDLHIDMLMVDEIDQGGTTALAKEVYECYAKNVKNVIYVTATYTKPVNAFGIHPDAMILWDIEDIYLCKNMDKINEARLCQKYDEDIIKTQVLIYSPEKIRETFSKFPELHLITTTFETDVATELKEFIKGDDRGYGFSISSMFMCRGKEFINDKPVIKLIEMIFGQPGIKQEANKTRCGFVKLDPKPNNIIARIERIQKFTNSRSSYDEPISILMYAPHGQRGIQIVDVSGAFINLVEKNNLIPDFDIIAINSKTKGNPVELINRKMEQLRKARVHSSTHKKGLLIITARQCTTGVSLPHCDIVLHLNDLHSADLIDQMNSRSSTEDNNKKTSFVVDLNIHRTINMMVGMADKVYPRLNTIKGIESLMEQRLVMLNCDEWLSDGVNGVFKVDSIKMNEYIKKIHESFKSNPVASTNYILSNITLNDNILGDDFEYYSRMFPLVAAKKPKSKANNNQQEENPVLEEQGKNPETSIPKGIVRVPGEIEEEPTDETGESSGSDEINETDDSDETNETRDSCDTDETEKQPEASTSIEDEEQVVDRLKRFKKVLFKIISLLCILTIKDKDVVNFMAMFLTLTDENKEIIINQLRLSENNNIPEDFMEKVMDTYEKCLKNNEEFNNKVKRIKELIVDAAGDGIKLQELLYKYLQPTEEEKKNNAEVSTPPALANEMYNKVVEYDPNLFKKPLKIFDPCTGKGVFMLVARDNLMKSLESEYPDEKERLRVIFKECLYFADKTPLNVYVTKLLLDPSGEYHDIMNYHIGDTLKLNIQETWGLDGFDLVIGNPPYQEIGESGRPKHGKVNLYTKFIQQAFKSWNKGGYISFVTPSSWMSPSSIVLQSMLQKTVLHLNVNECEKHFNVGSKFSYYVLYNSEFNNIITKVVCTHKKRTYNSNVILSPSYKWLPNVLTEEVLSIQSKVMTCKETKFIRMDNEYKKLQTVDEQTEEYSCPNIVKYNKKSYSSTKHKYHDSKKVLLFRSGYVRPMYDDGTHGVGENIMFCVVATEKEGRKLRQLYESKLYKMLMELNKFSGYNNGLVMNMLYNKLESLNENFTDAELYTMFKLSEKEVTFINEY